MPNWCAQKITFKGGNLKPLKDLLTPGFDQWYQKAAFQCKQFAALGVLGKLKPVFKVEIENYPALVTGVGKKTKANIAYTHWLGYIFNRAPLSQEIAENIDRLAQEANLPALAKKHLLKGLSDSDRRELRVDEDPPTEFKPLEYTPFNSFGEKTLPLSLFHLVPLLVGEESLPYCDLYYREKYKTDFSAGYEACIETLGSKWGTLWSQEGSELDKDDILILHTQSAWSPVLPALQAISLKLGCEVDVIYAEQGMGFYGRSRWMSGLPVFEETGTLSLKYDEEGELLPKQKLKPSYLEELNRLGG